MSPRQRTVGGHPAWLFGRMLRNPRPIVPAVGCCRGMSFRWSNRPSGASDAPQASDPTEKRPGLADRRRFLTANRWRWSRGGRCGPVVSAGSARYCAPGTRLVAEHERVKNCIGLLRRERRPTCISETVAPVASGKAGTVACEEEGKQAVTRHHRVTPQSRETCLTGSGVELQQPRGRPVRRE